MLICAEEACRLDHLFFVCRDLDPFYKGPGHPAIHFSGLNFRNGHLTRGRNAIVCALGDVDVVMDDCRVLRSRDAREGNAARTCWGSSPASSRASPRAWLEGGTRGVACVAAQ